MSPTCCGFQKEGKVRIAAVCDADDNHLEAAVNNVKGGRRSCLTAITATSSNGKDIDAVLIATPDHWHAVQTVHACQSGKHVYVEKPSSVTVREGQAMVNAARDNKVAVQVGAQARTAKGGWHTCRAIRNGIVGTRPQGDLLALPEPGGRQAAAGQREPPEGLDWDLWLGPLPWRPYNRRYHPANFRWVLESGGGNIRDRGAHQFSTDPLVHGCRPADVVHRRGHGPRADDAVFGTTRSRCMSSTSSRTRIGRSSGGSPATRSARPSSAMCSGATTAI